MGTVVTSAKDRLVEVALAFVEAVEEDGKYEPLFNELTAKCKEFNELVEALEEYEAEGEE